MAQPSQHEIKQELVDAIRMLELDRGANHVHEGGYGSYLEARAEREELAEK